MTKFASGITSPEEFFGFQMGSDRKIARWDKIVEYFWQLDKESANIKVEEVGKSTEGNPFLVVYISSEKNLSHLDEYREINSKLSDPRGLSQEEVEELVSKGKAVAVQTMSLHANEIGGTQMAPELAYELLAKDCEDTKKILDEVIFIMIPCWNPDGQIMVTDWYMKWLGTEFEGCNMPWLFHKYAGHDNNRDAFYQNLPESRYVGEVLLRKWHPQVFQDHHHMGSYAARLYIAPYSNPIRPYADPLVWREHAAFGGYMAYKLDENDMAGVISGGGFPGWGHFGFHWLVNFHNISGMLTESASAKLATPIYIHPEQLEGQNPKGMPTYEAQVDFPNPWPGGWWRLRNIVEQQKIAAWALLSYCAKHREELLFNAYQKAARQTRRGAEGKPVAYLIDPNQHDPLTVLKLVEVLLRQGIEVLKAKTVFKVGRKSYPEGTYLVPLAQPKMGIVRNLLGRTFFPDNHWTKLPDGSFAVFDTATDTVNEFMGVAIEEVNCPIAVETVKVESVSYPTAAISGRGETGFVIDPRLNDSFKVINKLLSMDVPVYRLCDSISVNEEGSSEHCANSHEFPPGAFYIPSQNQGEVESALGDGVSAYCVTIDENRERSKIKRNRIGVFQRYWAGNADEGWTRFLLEKYGFDFVTIRDKDVREGLNGKIDVLILPCDNYKYIVDLKAKEGKPLRLYWDMTVPEEYRSGLGEDVKLLKDFVERGGRLVTLGDSAEVAIKTLGLKVENVTEGLTPREYFCQGNTLWADFDVTCPFAYGMPERGLVLCWESPVFKITEKFRPHDFHVVAKYPQRDILQSGILVGEEKIAGHSAMISAKYGKGEAILIGFRPQFRAQTDGTFKILFNSLIK